MSSGWTPRADGLYRQAEGYSSAYRRWGCTGRIRGTGRAFDTEADSDIDRKLKITTSIQSRMPRKILLETRAAGVSANIYRGAICCLIRNRCFSVEHRKQRVLQKDTGIYCAGCMPDHEATFEFSNIDQTAGAIVLLFDRNQLINETFHLQNANRVSAQFLLRASIKPDTVCRCFLPSILSATF